ncbi:MAG: hypothetical protein J5803_01940 [Desulfovibrio sp.]|nr:hypothetical protein [Desulfovibrio sp.]
MEKEAKAKKGSGGVFFVSLILCLALAYCLYEAFMRGKEETQKALHERALFEKNLNLEEARMAHLQSLLDLSPCEAKAKWAKP